MQKKCLKEKLMFKRINCFKRFAFWKGRKLNVYLSFWLPPILIKAKHLRNYVN